MKWVLFIACSYFLGRTALAQIEINHNSDQSKAGRMERMRHSLGHK